ncbi:TIR domain-containing protein [Cohnella sp. 56]|uniref:TIR domain-containing protein n=1 Tax=Cohnella sp. 56 TaxID=3113722 RepID=UPI0030E88650
MSFQSEANNRYHLYLSYAWNHNGACDELCELLRRIEQFDPAFTLIAPDHPANRSSDERALYQTIKAKMKFCDVVILLVGGYPDYSRWINKELIACRDGLHKPVIAVQRDALDSASFIIKENADLMVGWDAESIIQAIKQIARKP